jgi:hypothetical protein
VPVVLMWQVVQVVQVVQVRPWVVPPSAARRS